MAFNTPLSRVEGLGSARSGVEHFWQQRATALALIPLTCWFIWAALGLAGADRDTILAFLHQPLNAVLMVLFVFNVVVHMALGIQVVIEDYVHGEAMKIACLLANRAFAWAVGATCLFAMYRIAL